MIRYWRKHFCNYATVSKVLHDGLNMRVVIYAENYEPKALSRSRNIHFIIRWKCHLEDNLEISPREGGADCISFEVKSDPK
jgi:hypothetical protein